MDRDLVALLGFVGMFALMALRVPIGVAMGIAGVAGFGALAGFTPGLNLLANVPLSVLTDYNLIVIPMFILMGAFASHSGMSAELFAAGRAWLHHRRGGLALASCGSGDESAGSGSDDYGVGTTTQTTTQTTTETETTPSPEQPTVVRIVLVDGSPQGGIVRESVAKGERVVLAVTSDVADEVHLHGYDVSRDIAAGGTVRLPFTAKLPGRFEVELEERGVQIAEITVTP